MMQSLKIWYNLPTSLAEELDTESTEAQFKKCTHTHILRRTSFLMISFSFFSILDQNDKDLIEDKLDAIASVYKKISNRDIVFEFRPEATYYTTKKP